MMMVGPTLLRYFSLRFAKWIVGLFLLVTLLIFMADFLEVVRRTADKEAFTLWRALAMSAFRVPSLVEQAIPFATLFGAIAAFVGLSRRLELVISRAAGISVWQFTAPALITVLVIGLFSVAVFNPISAMLKERSDEIGILLFGNEQRVVLQTTGAVWLRQSGTDGESVLHAEYALKQGTHLVGVTVYTFNDKGHYLQRIDAKDAFLGEGRWDMKDATVHRLGADPVSYKSYILSTYLDPAQVRQSLTKPDTISVWELPAFIRLAQNAGLPAYQYRLQYQMLLARPLLLVAMVLVAATVSLGFTRSGGVGRLILGGIVAGFVLYVVTEFAKGLGGAGIVPPSVAAWTPGMIATLLGFTVLLYREDG
ncbi:LPS export ABC transporter permease LptG [Rhodobium gokarnense]|uniref:Lipopolysaccharide export system permease protein n=1 Tax=Rhodobium gokarnense TaxID=364296 RepID=A0ABT3HFI3_9HYPH|nr:LPS export ABC transporter permease LptG [Rhodobium gokarnense]MCW2309168.1 lipopolysaccharide export system permease protein [Rhodobium gokarnense]